MKAFLNRINRGLSKEKDKDRDLAALREKIPQLPPLPDWPPQRTTSTPSTIDSSKPLPDLSLRPLPPIEEPFSSISTDSSATPTPIATLHPLPLDASEDGSSIPSKHGSSESSRSRPEPDSAGRSSRKATNGSMSNGTNGSATNGTNSDIQKKVAFLSPPSTPGPTSDRALPDAESPAPSTMKTTVSRFQATHVKDTRGSTSTAASSRTDVSSGRTTRQGSRAATSPFPARDYGDGASIHQSLRSTTPYSQTPNSSKHRILSAQSWSEVAEEDLVSNIGQRERTRQEVLWEIVASEERYVGELLKLKETFIDPLLHPYSMPSPITSPTPLDVDDSPRSDTPRESIEHLPIASRFLSPLGFRSDSPTGQAPSSPLQQDDGHPNIDSESMNSAEEGEADDKMGAAYHSARYKNVSGMSQAAKHNHPRSPYNSRSTGVLACGSGSRLLG
ncbi:uncharacterized protein FIBRA_04439 [Fibroporia radiculosa]|uniref:DH domain-containing protein n=1 Tax=Fibroporia radiculosa TaxID=599839 RepID=J4H2Y7_9APHY|nr:uncharacterized protein FIBRA_04439 [Fibroporia radiculosa]CCM02344.1 predicted protein [Fibroporia radiculosa]